MNDSERGGSQRNGSGGIGSETKRPERISRRRLLVAGVASLAGMLARRLALAAPACPDPTPGQIRGPFYPEADRKDEDTDLTRIEGHAERASGEVVYVRGRIFDEACRPVEGALVEIWQANTWGRYDHERDRGNPRKADPHFQGWGETLTDAEGRYGFKTVRPGPYPADDRGWIRPPHVHFRVSRRGYHELITQMYFAGEPLNEPDAIRGALTPAERAGVTVEFLPAPPDLEKGARLGLFDITLRKAG